MIDKNRIPESTYNELVELFGIKEAERIIIETNYNYLFISRIILGESLIRYFRLENFRLWLKRNTGLTMQILLLILIPIVLILSYFIRDL